MNIPEIKDLLEENYLKYNRRNFIDNDPISIPHLFSKKEDIEISAFLTSIISWGQRKTIIKNAKDLMMMMDMKMAEMGMNAIKMAEMEMPLPDNTIPMMTGQGPFGAVGMGGMFFELTAAAVAAHAPAQPRPTTTTSACSERSPLCFAPW